MLPGDIYVQVTASSESLGKSRSVVVLVPRANIEQFRSQTHDSISDDHSVARTLAEPLGSIRFHSPNNFCYFPIISLILSCSSTRNRRKISESIAERVESLGFLVRGAGVQPTDATRRRAA